MATNCILHLFLVPSVNNLVDRPSSSLSQADSRLSVSFWKWLQDAFGGPNGFIAGLAITWAFLGSQLADNVEHVGWRHAPPASHSWRVAQVLRPGGPSELLSRHDSSAQALADSYNDLNSLLHFTVAFPTGVSP